MPKLNIGRAAWYGLGMLSLLLGLIGVILPLLPTTPFIILAAFSFGKSSPKLQHWLENSKMFGPMIANWQRNGAIAPASKALAVGMMVAIIGLSVYIGLSLTIIAIQTAFILAAATFILTRPNR